MDCKITHCIKCKVNTVHVIDCIYNPTNQLLCLRCHMICFHNV